MTIDGTTLQTQYAEIRQRTVDMTTGTVTDGSDWTLIRQMPVIFRPHFGLKTCTVTLDLHVGCKQDAWKAEAEILEKMTRLSVFQFDGVSHGFRGVLTGHKMSERLIERIYRLTLTFTGQEVGDEIAIPRQWPSHEGFTVSNPGTAWSPTVIDINGLYPGTKIHGLLYDPVTLKEKTLHTATLVSMTGQAFSFSGVTGELDYLHGATSLEKPSNWDSLQRYTDDMKKFLFFNKEYSEISAFGLPMLPPGESRIYGEGTDTSGHVAITFRPVYI